MAPPRIALPRGRRALWIPVLAVMVIAHRGLAAEGATDADELRRRFAGEYLFVGGAAARALVPAAVERSVDGLFFIARGCARAICSSRTVLLISAAMSRG